MIINIKPARYVSHSCAVAGWRGGAKPEKATRANLRSFPGLSGRKGASSCEERGAARLSMNWKSASGGSAQAATHNETKPNKATSTKSNRMLGIGDKSRKQSHWAYQTYFQRVKDEKRAFSGPNERFAPAH